MGAFDGTVLNAVEDAESRHQFARCMDTDVELPAGHVVHHLREQLGGAVDGVERFRKAVRQTPADRSLGMCCRRNSRR
jgi:hypothetical protein